jgi:cell wall-associated NlpC family hydrolase
LHSTRTPLRALVLGGFVPAGLALAIAVPATGALAAPSREELQRQIRQSSTALEQVVEEYNTVNAALSRSRAAAAEIAERLKPLAAEYAAAVDAVGLLAADAYKTGRIGTLGALLDSGSAGGLLSRATALDQMARSRRAAIDAVAGRRAALQVEQRKRDALVASQAAQQQTLAARKAKITKDLDGLYALRKQVYGSASETGSASTATPPAVPGKAGVAVRFAYAALGKPYVWAASGPDGYDCSGLVLAAWRAAGGPTLTHASSVQWNETARVSRAQLQPGDLVFYSDLGHVALYVGNDQVIHAPTFGEVVKLASVDMMPPYGYGRVRL